MAKTATTDAERQRIICLAAMKSHTAASHTKIWVTEWLWWSRLGCNELRGMKRHWDASQPSRKPVR